MGKKNADRLPPDSEGASSAGADDVLVGDDESSLEAPRKPRSKAQVAATERMIAARNAKRAPAPEPERQNTASVDDSVVDDSVLNRIRKGKKVEDDSRQPVEDDSRQPRRPRKQRADKGKRRGHLVRAVEESYDDEYELQRVPSANLYGNFIIV